MQGSSSTVPDITGLVGNGKGYKAAETARFPARRHQITQADLTAGSCPPSR